MDSSNTHHDDDGAAERTWRYHVTPSDISIPLTVALTESKGQYINTCPPELVRALQYTLQFTAGLDYEILPEIALAMYDPDQQIVPLETDGGRKISWDLAKSEGVPLTVMFKTSRLVRTGHRPKEAVRLAAKLRIRAPNISDPLVVDLISAPFLIWAKKTWKDRSYDGAARAQVASLESPSLTLPLMEPADLEACAAAFDGAPTVPAPLRRPTLTTSASKNGVEMAVADGTSMSAKFRAIADGKGRQRKLPSALGRLGVANAEDSDEDSDEQSDASVQNQPDVKASVAGPPAEVERIEAEVVRQDSGFGMYPLLSPTDAEGSSTYGDFGNISNNDSVSPLLRNADMSSPLLRAPQASPAPTRPSALPHAVTAFPFRHRAVTDDANDAISNRGLENAVRGVITKKAKRAVTPLSSGSSERSRPSKRGREEVDPDQFGMPAKVIRTAVSEDGTRGRNLTRLLPTRTADDERQMSCAPSAQHSLRMDLPSLPPGMPLRGTTGEEWSPAGVAMSPNSFAYLGSVAVPVSTHQVNSGLFTSPVNRTPVELLPSISPTYPMFKFTELPYVGFSPAGG